MPLDPLAKRFLDMAGAASTGAVPRSLNARRNALAKLMQFTAADAMAGPGIDGTLPGPGGDIPYRLYMPGDGGFAALPGLVFFHGGGMVAGSIDTHDRICRALAREAGCRVLSIGYRLAPEHRFPAAVDDAIAATDWASANADVLGIDPGRLMVGGDSAGATLASVVCQHAARLGRPPIALQLLICPVLDFSAQWPSRSTFAEGYLIDKATLDADLADYLTEADDPTDPRISPLQAANLAGLPPAIIHTAEFDPLRDEGLAYVERLTAADVAVEHVCHDGMLHNFHAMGAILPQGREAIKLIGSQLRRATQPA